MSPTVDGASYTVVYAAGRKFASTAYNRLTTVTEYLEGPRHSKGRQELSLGQKEVGISEE